jgi:hypothetical protein
VNNIIIMEEDSSSVAINIDECDTPTRSPLVDNDFFMFSKLSRRGGSTRSSVTSLDSSQFAGKFNKLDFQRPVSALNFFCKKKQQSAAKVEIQILIGPK